MLLLYGVCSAAYYVWTWYLYGGTAPGHPPLLNLEEFCSAAGLKFSVYLLLSYLLYRGMALGAPVASPGRFLAWQIPALGVFVVGAHVLQGIVLEAFGWVRIFGGRLAFIHYVETVGFYLLQLTVVLTLKYFGTGQPSQPSEHEPTATPLLARKGNLEVVVDWTAVSHLQAFGNYTRTYIEGEAYLINAGLGKTLQSLPASSILQIHRSYAINLNYFEGVVRESRTLRASLHDGTLLPIGRTYLPALRKRMG